MYEDRSVRFGTHKWNASRVHIVHVHSSSCSVYKTTGLQAIVHGMWVSGRVETVDTDQ